MKKAFTLIELLVVIAIIAILAAILFPVFAQAKDSAKNTQLLSNVKQMGTSQMIYASDYDDFFVPTMASQPLIAGDYGWQDLLQPYMKNIDITLNPKRTRPASGAGTQFDWTRLQHFGMPARAAVNANATVRTNGYFSGTHGGLAVRYDGIAGFVNLADTNPDWLGRIAAPSLSTSSINEISETVLIAEYGMWDAWFSLFPTPLGTCARWNPPEYNGNEKGGFSYPFTTTTRPQTNRSGLYAGGDCFVPAGRTSYVRTDTSAKSVDFRGSFYSGLANKSGTTTYYVTKALNPAGL